MKKLAKISSGLYSPLAYSDMQKILGGQGTSKTTTTSTCYTSSTHGSCTDTRYDYYDDSGTQTGACIDHVCEQ